MWGLHNPLEATLNEPFFALTSFAVRVSMTTKGSSFSYLHVSDPLARRFVRVCGLNTWTWSVRLIWSSTVVVSLTWTWRAMSHIQMHLAPPPPIVCGRTFSARAMRLSSNAGSPCKALETPLLLPSFALFVAVEMFFHSPTSSISSVPSSESEAALDVGSPRSMAFKRPSVLSWEDLEGMGRQAADPRPI